MMTVKKPRKVENAIVVLEEDLIEGAYKQIRELRKRGPVFGMNARGRAREEHRRVKTAGGSGGEENA